MADDDDDRARAYVDRATRLPYDRHEESHPVAIEAHLEMFNLVTDVLEDGDEDDRAVSRRVGTASRSPVGLPAGPA